MKTRNFIAKNLTIGFMAFSICGIEAEAATLLRNSSGFSEPDQASSQVVTLKKNEKVKVIGRAKESEGKTWLPVEAGTKKAWIEEENLELTDGDVGFDPPVATTEAVETGPKPARLSLWLGAGPTVVFDKPVTNFPDHYPSRSFPGAALSLGGDVRFGRDNRWILGTRAVLPWTTERSQGPKEGRLFRLTSLGEGGYSLIPGNLDLVGLLGFTLIDGENQDFTFKIGATMGASLSWNLTPMIQGSRYQAIDFSVYHIEETRGMGATTLGVEDALCSVFQGGPGCISGIASEAWVMSLVYKFGWNK